MRYADRTPEEKAKILAYQREYKRKKRQELRAQQPPKPRGPKRKRKSESTPEEWEAYKAYQREWYQKQPPEKKEAIVKRCYDYASRHPEYRRDEHYRRCYGITLAQYNAMLEKQDHKCAICRIQDSEMKLRQRRLFATLVVDHCHASNRVRELLCDRCNDVLGKVGESVDLLNAFAAYITRHAQVA